MEHPSGSKERQASPDKEAAANIPLNISEQQELREAILYALEILTSTNSPSVVRSQINQVAVTGESPSMMQGRLSEPEQMFSSISVGESLDETANTSGMSITLVGSRPQDRLKYVSIPDSGTSARDTYFEVLRGHKQNPEGIVSFENIALHLDDLTPNKDGRLALFVDPRFDVTFAEAALAAKKMFEPIARDYISQEDYKTGTIEIGSEFNPEFRTQIDATLRITEIVNNAKSKDNKRTVSLVVTTPFNVRGHSVERTVTVAMDATLPEKGKQINAWTDKPEVVMRIQLNSETIGQKFLKPLLAREREDIDPTHFVAGTLRLLNPHERN